MADIKAIETRYKGYRFRSRLEARWAVFFDHALIALWEYEKEGFSLPSGWYLPDFWIQIWKCWIEIKPEYPTDHEKRLCEELAHHTDCPVLICYGLPLDGGVICYMGDVTDSSGGTGWWDGMSFGVSDENLTKLFCEPFRSDRVFVTPNFNSWDFVRANNRKHSDQEFERMYQRAADAAKSARFEHGERGRRQ